MGCLLQIGDLVRPVTIDSLRANIPSFDPPRWRFFRPSKKIFLAERSSSRYMTLLIWLLVIILPLQLYAWACTSLSKKIDELNAAAKVRFGQLAEDYIKLSADTDGKKADQWTPAERARGDKIRAEATTLYQVDAVRIFHEVHLLYRVSTFLLAEPRQILLEPPKEDQWFESFRVATQSVNVAQTEAQRLQGNSALISGIFVSFILPVLFGTIGAVAYIIRTISDQIRTSTFSSTSPIRHMMRAALGALAGVVVGLFGGLSTQLSLPPLAIAFLGGYGVEAVFSMFDGLIEKFRQTPK